MFREAGTESGLGAHRADYNRKCTPEDTFASSASTWLNNDGPRPLRQDTANGAGRPGLGSCRLKHCTACSGFSAAATDENVPKLRRFPVLAFRLAPLQATPTRWKSADHLFRFLVEGCRRFRPGLSRPSLQTRGRSERSKRNRHPILCRAQ